MHETHALPSLRIKRIYAPVGEDDGARVLVDRIWPRGVSKAHAALTLWLKAIAPTDELRQWFGHDPVRWDGFRARYRAELEANPEAVEQLLDIVRQGPTTLLYGAHDEAHNQAEVIREYVSERAARS